MINKTYTITIKGSGWQLGAVYLTDAQRKCLHDRYCDDIDRYIDGCHDGEITGESKAVDDVFDFCDCEQTVVQDWGADIQGARVIVKDSEGNIVYNSSLMKVKDGTTDEEVFEKHAEYDSFILQGTSVKGNPLLSGELSIDGDFDPRKLKLEGTCYHFNDEMFLGVNGMTYDGTDIDMESQSEDTVSIDYWLFDRKI